MCSQGMSKSDEEIEARYCVQLVLFFCLKLHISGAHEVKCSRTWNMDKVDEFVCFNYCIPVNKQLV